jgi:hypothetical protein
MPYLSGLLTGVVLTILVVFVIDHVGVRADQSTIVNWGVASDRIDASIDSVKEEVHEATAPDTPSSALPPASGDARGDPGG